jgi:dihydrofolate reductase
MPDTLRFDADWVYFQRALDSADVTLLGRHTHEAAPNTNRRRRLVVSRGVRAVIQENACTWWVNPSEVAPASAIAAVAGADAVAAVVGGMGVFDWILAEGGFDSFHLSVAHHVRLGAGRPLVDGAPDLDAAIATLNANGLHAAPAIWLDESAGLELMTFEKDDGR